MNKSDQNNTSDLVLNNEDKLKAIAISNEIECNRNIFMVIELIITTIF